MGLKTRLDGRSEDNCTIYLNKPDGTAIAEFKVVDCKAFNVELTSTEGYYFSKENGWKSKPGK